MIPEECVTLSYSADLQLNVPFGQVATNTAQTTTSSLPGDNGTGNVTPGAPGDSDGERTASGGVNDLLASDTADVTVDIPNMTKEKVNDSDPYAIGEEETYRVTVGVSVGITENFVITDVLPEGLTYIAGTQSATVPSDFLADNNPPTFTWDSGTRTLTWDFGDIDKDPPAADIVIEYDVQVENILTNQDGEHPRQYRHVDLRGRLDPEFQHQHVDGGRA